MSQGHCPPFNHLTLGSPGGLYCHVLCSGATISFLAPDCQGSRFYISEPPSFLHMTKNQELQITEVEQSWQNHLVPS